MVTDKEKNKVALAFVGLIAMAGIGAAYTDEKEDQRELAHYCEMVQVWQQDAENGVPADKRNGWPNYKKLECNSGS